MGLAFIDPSAGFVFPFSKRKLGRCVKCKLKQKAKICKSHKHMFYSKKNVRKLQTKEMYLKKESDHVEFNGSIASQKVVTGPCSPL